VLEAAVFAPTGTETAAGGACVFALQIAEYDLAGACLASVSFVLRSLLKPCGGGRGG
jgi:hypothetical protein